jgi:hypothetical protein
MAADDARLMHGPLGLAKQRRIATAVYRRHYFTGKT